MKLRTLTKVAVTSSVVLLCTGFVVFSYFKLTAVRDRETVDLYTLMSPTVTAVFETNNAGHFVQNINELTSSKENHFLYTSKLFSYLKLYVYTLLEETPHGLSRQMNQMLLSFHQPGSDRDQVLYCTLGKDDLQLVEKFITKFCSSSFPTKLFDYKGEEIRIYPLPDGDFLACYYDAGFFVASFQKKLIEEAIDARLTGQSLLKDQAFVSVREMKKREADAVVYLRTHRIAMGKPADTLHRQMPIGGWMEFDMSLKENTIYLSGVSREANIDRSFVRLFSKQLPLQGFPGAILPASTYSFSRCTLGDVNETFEFTSDMMRVENGAVDGLRERNKELIDYLKEINGQEMLTCLFQQTDTVNCPAAVVALSVKDVPLAECALRHLLSTMPREENQRGKAPITFSYIAGKRVYVVYQLPSNTLFAQLTGIAQPELRVYATFYDAQLLLAPHKENLSAYITQLEKGEVLEKESYYQNGVSGLSDAYHFMLVTDLSKMLQQPEEYARLLPEFFFRHPDFFRHFILSAQFISSEGVVYPNMVLTYQGD